MEEKFNVLGVELDCLSAKDAMLQAIQFLEDETLDTIGIVSMDMLLSGQDDRLWTEQLGQMKMLLPGEAEILEAGEIHDWIRLKEAGERTFLKMFMKYLQKQHKRVFLLAGSEGELRRVEEAVSRYNRGIRMTGHALLGQDGVQEEEVVNEINGTETDCILSVLPSPYQEEFILRNKALLNSRVWLGCGNILWKSYDERKLLKHIKHFILKKIFRYQVEKQQKES